VMLAKPMIFLDSGRGGRTKRASPDPTPKTPKYCKHINL
jgi:hypothetical protein